ncbi:MAG: c-type cytochrome [Bacteroidota bacterium]
MKQSFIGGSILISALIIMGFVFIPASGSGTMSPAELAQDSAAQSDNSVNVEKEISKLKDAIKGKEDKPVTEVFKNIKAFDPKMPAGRLPDIMAMWCRTLGVTCKNCHLMGDWDKDDQIPKETARGMMQMVNDINTKTFKTIKGLDEDSRIGCWTCHRGRKKPESRPPRTGRDGR